MSGDKDSGGTGKTGFFGRLFGGRGSGPAPSSKAPATPPAAPPAADQPAATSSQVDDTSVHETTRSTEPAPPPEVASPPPAAERKSWLQRLSAGLTRTSSKLTEGIVGVFTKRKLDADTLQDLEDLLIQADLGLETAMRITEAVGKGRYDKQISPEAVSRIVADEVERVLEPVARPLVIDPAHEPHVVLVVGVNGSGKTTTIGKLAAQEIAKGRKVMLAAGDTFRAAAIDQLKVWGERTGAVVAAREVGSDAAGLAFDALSSAKEHNYDVLFMDTAGRLQNKQGLMDELEKIVRVLKKVDPSAPHDVLLVLDATTGQNALRQVEVFAERAGVTGLVMTKLDGTARGGILVSIAAAHQIAVHAVGVGESVEDLQPFDARSFASAIAGLDVGTAAGTRH